MGVGGIEPNIFMQEGMSKLDYNRIKKMNKKSRTLCKLRRKQLRAIKKGYIYHEKELEKDPQYTIAADFNLSMLLLTSNFSSFFGFF